MPDADLAELRARRTERADLNERFAERVLGHVWAVLVPGKAAEDSELRTHRSLMPTPLSEDWTPADLALPVTRWNQLFDYASFVGLAWEGAEALRRRDYLIDVVTLGTYWQVTVMPPSGMPVIQQDREVAAALVHACLAAVEGGAP